MTFNHLTKKRDRNSFSRSRFGSTWNRTHSNAHEFRGFTGASTEKLAYNVKGNQTSRPSTLSAPALNLDWNFDNQLRGADTNGSSGSLEVTFEYDALGRRVSRSHSSGNVVYVHAGQQVIADYARGAVTSSPTYRYVYADYVDEPILRHTGTATTLPTTGDNALYYHRNQQYSIIGLTNAAGTLVERYSYSAYGTLGIYDASGTVRMTSTYANRYTYTGREYDADLNLYHFRARWYDSSTGGFISRDPLGYEDGMSLYRGYFGIQELDPNGLETKKGTKSGSCVRSCDLQAEFYDVISAIIRQKIIELVGKKVAKALARSVVLSLCDGPLPIGEIVSLAWGAWDIYQTVSEVGQLMEVFEEMRKAVQSNLTRKLNILEECLETDAACCSKVKSLIREFAEQFGDIRHTSPPHYKKRVKVSLGAKAHDMFEIAKACCDMSPCYRPTRNQREFVLGRNRDLNGGRLACEHSGSRVCRSPGQPNSIDLDHDPIPFRDGGLTFTDNLKVSTRTINRADKHH